MTLIHTDGTLQVQDSQTKLEALQFEWLSRISRLSGIALIVVDVNLDIKFYDDSVANLLELDPSIDYKGDNILHVIAQLAKRGDFGSGDPETFVELTRKQFRKAGQSDKANNRIVNFLTPSGRRIQFSQDHEADGMHMMSCRDVTENYINKHALKVALDSSDSGYLIYDMDTKKFQTNDTSCLDNQTSKLTQRLMNNDLKDVLHVEDYKKLRILWINAHRTKKPWTGTFRTNNSQAETVWVRVQATPQISVSGAVTGYIFFYSEVTSQLRVQDELRKAKEQAEKSLSAKNAFLGRLSHEIRTPMNAVVGIADALIHHDGNPKILPKLELIQTSAEKIIRIVDESLEHTKLAESKIQIDPHPASPSEAVESVCALWEQKAVENGIDLECRIDPSVPETIIFDNYRFEQCLNNLVSNAVKFSPAGRIKVVLTTLEKNGTNTLVTVVKDTGIGMNSAQLANLFEAYTQADKSISGRFGGTGLGMNITKQLIELMGGKITARSELGSGTVIALILPIQSERRTDVSCRRKSTSESLVDDLLEDSVPPASEYSNLKVLVVDDNATNHMVVTSLLGTLVKHVDVAENGIEAIDALKKAEAENNQFDIILMDIHMPVMDGIEATLAIRGSEYPFTNIPIIALTADPQYQQKRLCKNIGMDDALSKPVKLTEVLGAIDRVFNIRNNSELAA